jgi:uncharacterized protein YecT (DUF1311 family)
MRLAIAFLIFAFAFLSWAADEKESRTRLVSAPNGEYALEWTSPPGALRVVSMDNRSSEAELDISRFGRVLGSAATDMPLPFISPDSNWVFILSAPSEAAPPDSFNRPVILLRRMRSNDGKPQFQPAMADRFEKAAWEFLDHELKLKRTDLPADAARVYSADFVDWSRDSGRLLIKVAGGAWSPSKSEWVEPGAYSWYCYFNTRSDKFELTDRLRFADTRPERNGLTADDTTALIAIVTNAESIGEQGPQRSPKEHFDQADKRLNDVYGKLVKQVEPAKREALREEQRAWLVLRDAGAQVAAIQAWSSGRESLARILESKATATETRTAELEKRLAK